MEADSSDSDKQYPCSNCSKFSRECLYLAPAMEMMARQRTETKQSPGTERSSLDALLEEDSLRIDLDLRIPQPELPLSLEDTQAPSIQLTDDIFTKDDYEHYLEPVSAGAMTVAYGDDYSDPELDLGVSIGKMWMTDRIGGLFRPHIHKEIERMLQDPTSDRRTLTEKQRTLPLLADDGRDFLGMRFDYIEPHIVWANSGRHDAQQEAFLGLLPGKSMSDALVDRYFSSVHSITPVLHWSTFQQQYALFWRIAMAGLEPAPWLRALVFAVLFAAAASVAAESADHSNLASRIAARDRMQNAAEDALHASNVLHGARLEILQALVITLMPMYGVQVSRAHSSLVGMIASLSESMGLHKEVPTSQNMPEVERHVRRLLWFHVSTLDLRVSYAHSPRLLIRPSGYSTQMPSNVDEDRIDTATTQDARAWNSMSFCRMYFELVEMQKRIIVDREALERREIQVTECLKTIETFRKDMEARFGRLLDHTKPPQRYARLVLNLMVHMCYVMILFRYLRQYGQRVPSRLRQLTLHAAVLAMESAIELDRAPELIQWKWHNGCYQQWQIAFLLLSHINRTPEQSQAHRIWKVIDYVFEIDPSLSPAVKVRAIMTIIGERTRTYHSARHIRVPDNTKNQRSGRGNDHIAGRAASAAIERLATEASPLLPDGAVDANRFHSNSTSMFQKTTSSPDHMNGGDMAREFSIEQNGAEPGVQQAPRMQRPQLPLYPESFTTSDYQSVPAQYPGPGLPQNFTTPGSHSSWSEPGMPHFDLNDIDWQEWDVMMGPDAFMDF